MSAAELISSLKSEGVRLSVDAGGNLRCQGDRDKVNAILPKLKAHRPELLALLTTRAPTAASPQPMPHPGLERAATGATEGGMAYAEPKPAADATPADHQHAEYVRDMIHAGWVWDGGRWHAPGAWRATSTSLGGGA
jgi:hypothetical protein